MKIIYMQRILEKLKEHWILILILGLFACAGFAANVKTIFSKDKSQDKTKQATSNEIYNVSSDGQQGGITAGKIIVETGPSPRHLTPENLKELNKFLPPDKSFKIQVWYLMGNAEAQRYASEIKAYLESQKWEVDPYLGWFNWGEPVVGINVRKFEDEHKWRFEVGSILQ